jgi:hypothetical protein
MNNADESPDSEEEAPSLCGLRTMQYVHWVLAFAIA